MIGIESPQACPSIVDLLFPKVLGRSEGSGRLVLVGVDPCRLVFDLGRWSRR
jgi:hypothetical protein